MNYVSHYLPLRNAIDRVAEVVGNRGDAWEQMKSAARDGRLLVAEGAARLAIEPCMFASAELIELEDEEESKLVCSHGAGLAIVADVVVLRGQVDQLWPPGSVRRQMPKRLPRVEAAILAHLERIMQPTPDFPIRKDAFESCERANIQAFSEKAFERVWKAFPDDRKRSRGKHGPRR